MAANVKVRDDEKKTVSETVSAFLIKYRLVIIGLVAVLFAAAIITGIVFGVSSHIHAKGFAELDTLTVSFSDAKKNLTGGELTAKEDEILASLKELGGKNRRNDVGARSYMLAAEISFSRGAWDDARSSWISAAQANPKSYTAPLCYYNAAVCSEELGDTDAAVEYYGEAVLSDTFGRKPRAIFNIGRIEDQRGNYTAAATQYELLTAQYPADNWSSLAESRLIALRAEGKIE